MSPALFFDRDGVINVDTHYLHKIEEFKFTEGIIPTLKRLQSKYKIIIITNQSGIGRGYFTEDAYQTLTHWMVSTLKEKGIDITDVKHCPHSPEDNCECRKPSPHMVLSAAKEHNIDLSNSCMIGDKKSDLHCGNNAGLKKLIFINNGLNPITEPLPFPYSSTDTVSDIPALLGV
jgi:D-glycero-D-manno-heptose 1,7-bisphosphate phosphatase